MQRREGMGRERSGFGKGSEMAGTTLILVITSNRVVVCRIGVRCFKYVCACKCVREGACKRAYCSSVIQLEFLFQPSGRESKAESELVTSRIAWVEEGGTVKHTDSRVHFFTSVTVQRTLRDRVTRWIVF